MQTVICLRWGTRYGVEYANCLYRMVRRHTERPLRFVCFTDDPTGLEPGIEAKPLPQMALPDRLQRTTWYKLCLWQPDLGNLEGNVLFLDLDMIVTGSIDGFFDYEPEASFVVAENWHQRGEGIGNTSVFRFRIGSHPYLYDRFLNDPPKYKSKYPNEQTLISREISEMVFWPSEWCISFKHSIMPNWPLNYFVTPKLPPDARVVAFTGKPDPHEARDGKWPPRKWYHRFYKHVRPTPWIAEHWR